MAETRRATRRATIIAVRLQTTGTDIIMRDHSARILGHD